MNTLSRSALAILPFLAASSAVVAQDPPNKPAPPPVVDQKKIDEAINKGVAFLKQQGVKGSHGRASELVLLTLLHAGMDEEDSHVKFELNAMLAAELQRTYNVAIQAMILEKLHRVKHQKRIFHCAQFLVDNQHEYGQWGYGEPTKLVDPPAGTPTGDAPKVATKGLAGKKAPPVDEKRVRFRIPVKRNPDHKPGSRGDDSNSQYAALGLRAAHDAGIILPKETVEKAAKSWRDLQVSDSGKSKDPADEKRVATGPETADPAGWGYSPENAKSGKGTGSMTVGGLAAVCIYDYILGQNWKADLDVREAMAWMTKHFTVTENANKGPEKHHYYYLYGMERAGDLYGTDWFGTHQWYPIGAKYLIESQKPDGSWLGNDTPTIDTCFAILFLKRATRPLDVASTDGRAPVANPPAKPADEKK
jgi:hypothetical protein